MRITCEKLEGENFLDISLTLEEIEAIKDCILISEDAELFGIRINVGISLEMD